MTSKMNLPSNPMALITTTVLNKSLSSMVKGIRGHRDAGELEYINQCINEIKEELKTNFPEVKAQALQKLIYLSMIGYDCSWANFHIVEVMSSQWFGHKRIGYLAASIIFDQSTDVILLTTHLLRKGFSGNVQSGVAAAEGVQFEQGAAISCLAAIATPDLAMDLLNDVFVLMTSSRPYIRKKAVLVLLRLFRVWPKALRLSFDRLREKLEDENAGVVSAAVYVICELAAKNPKNYLSLAPLLFKLLTSSSNNWVLIKVVKLLGLLSPVEPRLAKKLIDPLTDLITTTPAKSLLYECVNCMLSGELRSKSAIRLCLDKLRTFIEDPDQNLKYLGLLGLHKLMLKHPRVVSEHKDLMLACLNDEDVTIRMRALDLIVAMVNPKNLTGILRKLQDHLSVSEGVYREHVLSLMLQIGSADNYGCVRDFESYVSLLLDLASLSGVSLRNAHEIANQLSDVCIRVPGVRGYVVNTCISRLIDGSWISQSQENKNMDSVLQAVGFLIGEFAEYINQHDRLIGGMLTPQLRQCSQSTQSTFIHSAIKVFASALNQPFDQSSSQSLEPEIAKPVKDLLGRRDLDEAEEGNHSSLSPSGDGDDEIDETPVIESTTQSVNLPSPTDAEPETEEEELDENGVKKRKVRAVNRSYAEWLKWIASMIDRLLDCLPVFTRSDSIEVQERAVTYLAYLNWFSREAGLEPFMKSRSPSDASTNQSINQSIDLLDLDVTSSLSSSITNSPTNSSSIPLPDRAHVINLSIQTNLLFSERLNPVNPKAQRKVPVPKGLNLDQPINAGWDKDSEDEQFSSTSEDEEDQNARKSKSRSSRRDRKDDRESKKSRKKKQYSDESDEYTKPQSLEEKQASKQRLDARKQAQQHDPFYIKPTTSTSQSINQSNNQSPPVDLLSGEPVRERKKPRAVRDKEKEREKEKKRDRADDDMFAGVDTMKPSTIKTYKVKQTADMPSDAAPSSQEDKDEDSDSDFPSKHKKKSSKRSDKDKKDDKKDRDSKDKKRDEKEKDKKRDEKEKEKEKDKKRDRDGKDKKRDRDADKDKEREKDKKRDGDSEKDKEREKDKKRDRDTDKEKHKKRDRSEKSEKGEKSDRRSKKDESDAPAQGLDLFDPFAASPAKPKRERSSRH